MAILICAATAGELAALAPDVFKNPAAIPEMQPMKGELGSGSAIFVATGVGPVNAALSIGYALGVTGSEKIDYILCAGLAGSFDLEIAPLCSIWRVNEEIWPEYGLNDGARITARAFSHPIWKRDNADSVYDRISLSDISAIEHKPEAEQWPAGISLTVAGVTASFGRRDSLWNQWHAPLENMEGFAIAYAAARAGIPCVEIRCVSNKAGPRGKNEKDFDGALKTMTQILPALNLA